MEVTQKVWPRVVMFESVFKILSLKAAPKGNIGFQWLSLHLSAEKPQGIRSKGYLKLWLVL